LLATGILVHLPLKLSLLLLLPFHLQPIFALLTLILHLLRGLGLSQWYQTNQDCGCRKLHRKPLLDESTRPQASRCVLGACRRALKVAGVEMKRSLDFGAGVLDHRGLLKNGGA
jgi:hypothetical protein